MSVPSLLERKTPIHHRLTNNSRKPLRPVSLYASGVGMQNAKNRSRKKPKPPCATFLWSKTEAKVRASIAACLHQNKRFSVEHISPYFSVSYSKTSLYDKIFLLVHLRNFFPDLFRIEIRRNRLVHISLHFFQRRCFGGYSILRDFNIGNPRYAI